MSEAAEAIDELNGRRRQPDASEVFMYTFAAVGALTLAEMDSADAAVPGAAAHGHSLIPPAPGAVGPHGATDSAFRAAISVLTAPSGDGSETPAQSPQVASDPGALTATGSETPSSDAPGAVTPMFAAPDRFNAIPGVAAESLGSSEAPLVDASLQNPLAALAGDITDVNEPSPLAVYAASPAQLGASDFLQSLGAYQTLSPEAVIAGFGEGATAPTPSLGAAVRADGA